MDLLFNNVMEKWYFKILGLILEIVKGVIEYLLYFGFEKCL